VPYNNNNSLRVRARSTGDIEIIIKIAFHCKQREREKSNHAAPTGQRAPEKYNNK